MFILLVLQPRPPQAEENTYIYGLPLWVHGVPSVTWGGSVFEFLIFFPNMFSTPTETHPVLLRAVRAETGDLSALLQDFIRKGAEPERLGVRVPMCDTLQVKTDLHSITNHPQTHASARVPQATQHYTSPFFGRFSKLGYSAPRANPIPNGTLSESCRREPSNNTFFGADTLFRVE